MSNSTICQPATKPTGPQDAFTFGSAAPDMQGVQNLMTMMTAPWTAFMALSSEMAREALRTRD